MKMDTRLKRLVNRSDRYACVGKNVKGHTAFMDALPGKDGEGDIHIHDRDGRSYRVFTTRGWGSLWEGNRELRLCWDGSTDEIVVGKVGRTDFQLFVDQNGGLKAESI